MNDLRSDDPTVADELSIRDAMRSEELQNDFMRRHEDVLDGFRRLNGMDAVNAAPDAEAVLSRHRDHLIEQADNPNQRRILADDLNAHIAVARGDIAHHAGRQALAWEQGVAQDRLDLLKQKAAENYADPSQLDIYVDASAMAARGVARALGFPVASGQASMYAAAARSALYRSAIEAALGNDAHDAAVNLYSRLKGRLAPEDLASLDPEMAIVREMQTGKSYVGQIAPASNLPLTLAEADVAHQAATQQNQADWAGDPSQQAANQHLIDVQFGSHKRGIDRAKIERDQAVNDWLARGDIDGRPQTSRPPPSIWARLDRSEQRSIDAVLIENARLPDVASRKVGQPNAAPEPKPTPSAPEQAPGPRPEFKPPPGQLEKMLHPVEPDPDKDIFPPLDPRSPPTHMPSQDEDKPPPIEVPEPEDPWHRIV